MIDPAEGIAIVSRTDLVILMAIMTLMTIAAIVFVVRYFGDTIKTLSESNASLAEGRSTAIDTQAETNKQLNAQLVAVNKQVVGILETIKNQFTVFNMTVLRIDERQDKTLEMVEMHDEADQMRHDDLKGLITGLQQAVAKVQGGQDVLTAAVDSLCKTDATNVDVLQTLIREMNQVQSGILASINDRLETLCESTISVEPDAIEASEQAQSIQKAAPKLALEGGLL